MNTQTEPVFRIGRIVDWRIDDELHVTLGKPNKDSKWLTVPLKELKRIHGHTRAKTRGGKTSRALIPYIQMLLQHDNMLLILDHGGDASMRKAAESEAKSQGKKFRFFSLNPEHESNWLDPFAALGKNSRSAINVAEFLVAALSCEHGLGYGGLFFSMANLATLLSAAKQVEATGNPFCLEDAVKAIEKGSPKDGQQIRYMLSVLLEFSQLSEQEGVEPISFDEAIDDGEVIYFWLPSLVSAMSARQISGLALYGVLAAAMKRVDLGVEDKHTFILCDEAQELMGRNFSSLMCHASKFKVSLMLSNQTTEQLKSSDTDLTSIVSDNTSLKIYFTVTTKEDFEALQLFSKDRIITLKSESVSQANPFATIAEREVVRPVIEKNLILEVSATEGYAFVIYDDGKGHKEPQVVYLEHGLSQEVYAEKYSMPRRDPSKIISKPVVGVHVPYVPSWQQDHSEDLKWQARQKKLAMLWEGN